MPPDPAPVLEQFVNIPLVIPFKYMFWIISLRAFYMKRYYFTTFAKKDTYSRIGRWVGLQGGGGER